MSKIVTRTLRRVTKKNGRIIKSYRKTTKTTTRKGKKAAPAPTPLDAAIDAHLHADAVSA